MWVLEFRFGNHARQWTISSWMNSVELVNVCFLSQFLRSVRILWIQLNLNLLSIFSWGIESIIYDQYSEVSFFYTSAFLLKEVLSNCKPNIFWIRINFPQFIIKVDWMKKITTYTKFQKITQRTLRSEKYEIVHFNMA